MSRRLFSALLLSLSIAPARGACIAESLDPLESQLRAADVVYVGTVVASKIDTTTDPLPKRPKRFEYLQVHHVIAPQAIYKGDPSALDDITSWALAWDPTWMTGVRAPELVTIATGDVVLIVGDNKGTASIVFCAASRLWDHDAKRAVEAVFPAAR